MIKLFITRIIIALGNIIGNTFSVSVRKYGCLRQAEEKEGINLVLDVRYLALVLEKSPMGSFI